MLLSIFKFVILVVSKERVGKLRFRQGQGQENLVKLELFDMALVFIFEDSISVYFQYFFFDKYAYSGLSLQDPSIRLILANSIVKGLLYLWKIYSLAYKL